MGLLEVLVSVDLCLMCFMLKQNLLQRLKMTITITSQKSNMTFKLRCVRINILDFIIYHLCSRLLG